MDGKVCPAPFRHRRENRAAFVPVPPRPAQSFAPGFRRPSTPRCGADGTALQVISGDRVLRHGMFVTAKKCARHHRRSIHHADGFRGHLLVKQANLLDPNITAIGLQGQLLPQESDPCRRLARQTAANDRVWSENFKVSCRPGERHADTGDAGSTGSSATCGPPTTFRSYVDITWLSAIPIENIRRRIKQ